MKISELIKYYRKQKNLTQKELADKLGISHDTVSLWEKGKSKPDYDTLRKICVLYEITGDEILELETEFQRKQVKIFNSFNNSIINSKNNNINF